MKGMAPLWLMRTKRSGAPSRKPQESQRGRTPVFAVPKEFFWCTRHRDQRYDRKLGSDPTYVGRSESPRRGSQGPPASSVHVDPSHAALVHQKARVGGTRRLLESFRAAARTLWAEVEEGWKCLRGSFTAKRCGGQMRRRRTGSSRIRRPGNPTGLQ